MNQKLILIKPRKNHRLFKKGQKLWEIYSTGALASLVVGRYNGKGRWIKAWVHFPDKEDYGENTTKGFSCKADADYIGRVDVTEDFYKYIYSLSGF